MGGRGVRRAELKPGPCRGILIGVRHTFGPVDTPAQRAVSYECRPWVMDERTIILDSTLKETPKMRSDQSNMERIQVSLGLFAPPFVTTPHGQFRLSNPTAFRPGRAHVIEYFPLDQWARIIETADARFGTRSIPSCRSWPRQPDPAVEVLAEDAEQAKRLALEAMMARSTGGSGRERCSGTSCGPDDRSCARGLPGSGCTGSAT